MAEGKKIISYNINGIRAAIKKGFWDWLKDNSYDLILLQEIKASPDQIDLGPLEELGYRHYWFPAEKRGYSGVAAFSRMEPDLLKIGCGIEQYDQEGRVMQLDFGDISILNIYFPSGSSGEQRQGIKMEFLDDIYRYIQDLRKKRSKMIVVGDYNICHEEMDIHNPVSNKNSSGFLPEEREWMSKFFDSGFVDSFRHFVKDPGHYTWWSYRTNARPSNKGWRIDYQAVTESLKANMMGAEILDKVKHSDHCPVYLQIIF